jgi:hypothetical protein
VSVIVEKTTASNPVERDESQCKKKMKVDAKDTGSSIPDFGRRLSTLKAMQDNPAKQLQSLEEFLREIIIEVSPADKDCFVLKVIPPKPASAKKKNGGKNKE